MNNSITPLEALNRAAVTVGGFSALGRRIGVTPQAIRGWQMRGYVPATRVLEIERLTGESRCLLRPDIYPPPGASDG